MKFPKGTLMMFRFNERDKEQHRHFYDRLEGKIVEWDTDNDTPPGWTTHVWVDGERQICLVRWLMLADNVEEE